MNEQSDRSWWSRHWMWFVPVGCLGSVFVCAGGVTLLATLIFGIIKSSDVYEESLRLIRSSSAVQAALGSPIDAAFLVRGNIEVTSASGHADIAYDVSGPQGSATAYVVADKSAGRWTFTSLVVELETSGQRMDLLEASNLLEGVP